MKGLKTINVEFSCYGGKYECEAILPVDIPWVVYNDLIDSGYSGHVNYWTIIPATFENLRKIAKCSHIEVTRINDVYLLILDTCAPIKELNTIHWKDLYHIYNIENYVGIKISTDAGCVNTVFVINELEHPYKAKISAIDLYTIDGDEITRAVSDVINLMRFKYFWKYKLIISNKPDIFDSAFHCFAIKMYDLNLSFSKYMWKANSIEDYDKLIKQFE